MVQWLGHWPGRVSDLLPAADPQLLPPANVPLGELAEAAGASPRANGYLSLESGLRTWRSEETGGVLTWAATRRAAFVVGGVHSALQSAASGEDHRAETLEGFRRRATEAGFRHVLVFPVATDERRIVRSAGFTSLPVGSEAFVSPLDFTLRGKRFADLRQMVNRGTRRYGLRVRELGADDARQATRGLYDRWLTTRWVRNQMRLLIGTPCWERAAGRRFFVAQAEDSAHAAALVTLTPGWGGQGWGVDVMARAPDAPAGAMEVLLSGIIERVADEGAHTVSLGACPMAQKTEFPWRDSRLLRGIFRYLYGSRLGNRFFHFRSLVHFKDKFAPRWEAVHIAAAPRMGIWPLYAGCRMWGLFGPPRLIVGLPTTADTSATAPPRLPPPAAPPKPRDNSSTAV